MKDLATATVATIAMTMFGVPTVLILAGVDRRWLAVVGILAVSPFLVVFYNRLLELQAQGKNRVLMAQTMRLDSGRHTADSSNSHNVLDVKPRLLEALPEPWATSAPEEISDVDLEAFVTKMYQHDSWSKRTAANWRLPSGWCSQSKWEGAMRRLEEAGVLGPSVNGRTRPLLVKSRDEALQILGLQPAVTGGTGGEPETSARNFVVRVFD